MGSTLGKEEHGAACHESETDHVEHCRASSTGEGQLEATVGRNVDHLRVDLNVGRGGVDDELDRLSQQLVAIWCGDLDQVVLVEAIGTGERTASPSAQPL